MRTVSAVYTFASKSDPDKEPYQTLVYDDGTLSCDCPGWTRRRQADGSRTCRHVRAIELRDTSGAAAGKVYGPPPSPRQLVQQQLARVVPMESRRAFSLEEA